MYQILKSPIEWKCDDKQDYVWNKSKEIPDRPCVSKENVWDEQKEVTSNCNEFWDDVLEWEEVPDIFNKRVCLH